MIKRLAILGLSMSVGASVAACGSSTTPATGGGGASYRTATPAPSTTASSAPAAAPAAAASVIVTQNMSLGPILADPSGRTLYHFLPEKGGKIVCTAACLSAWPAYLSSSAVGGPGVTGTLGNVTRPEGGRQLTYNTWPLYYFVNDTGPDQTNGQGIVAFGGKWLVATPGLQP
jgi:predicted lipoprotein with Yx(FWY)xxD motif